MLKPKLQYFGHLMWRADSLEKTLMLGKIEGRRRRGQQRMRWLDSITDSMNMSERAPGDGDGQGNLACCSPWSHKETDTTEWTDWSWERLKAGGEGDDRRWDSWMASLTQWSWVWENSNYPGYSGGQWILSILQSMGSQTFGHDWATEQQLQRFKTRI